MVYVNQWLILLLMFVMFCIGVWLGMGFGREERNADSEELISDYIDDRAKLLDIITEQKKAIKEARSVSNQIK